MADSTASGGGQDGNSETGIDPLVEAREIAASAAALVRELVEEDVMSFERVAVQPVDDPAAFAPSSPASRTPARSPAKSAAPETNRTTSARPPAGGADDHEASSAPESRTIGPSAPVPWGDARPSLDQVREHLGDCTRCGLASGRSTIVFGDGNPDADIMFIGEGPGEQEDRRGLPFVGRAGELLTQMIEKGIGLSRSDVYICNIVKCRPPRNRTPLPPEVSACRPFLDGQIQAVAPKVIVTLGKPAASLLLEREIAITRIRGTWHDYQGIPLMPTLHPAYVLRQYTPENRRAVWQDLQAAFERSRA